MKTLFVNGHIFTSDRQQLYAETMLVEDGVIKWVGSGVGDEKADVVDLKGQTVIPGIVDAHMHPMMLAEYSKQIACLPPRVNSIEELISEISSAAKATEEGGWVRGWGYDEGKYAEKRSPNRWDLDRGCADKPVFLVRSCEHIRCVNSKALEIAGITGDTPDPPGGKIDRSDTGEPTGILRESARNLVIPFLPEETEDQLVSALVDLGDLLSSQGIVAIGDMGNLHPGGNYEYYIKAAKRGFQQRVTLYYMWDYFDGDPDFDITPQLLDSDARIRVAGLKLIGDGSTSGRTAWLTDPYLGTEEYGMPVYSDELMESAIAFAKEKGCQLAVHAMGGRAIDRVVDRLCEEEDWTDGSFPYLRVEHLTEPSDEAIAKAAKKGFAFTSQPIFAYSEIETYRVTMGEARLKKLYPLRTILKRGVKLCISTDAPATSWATPSDPFVNIKAAVTRRACDGTDTGQEQRLDIETAIILYTKEAAEICGFGRLGQLAPGFSADFVVLSDDIFSVDADQIDRICAMETWIGGKCVYSKESS